MPAMVPPPSVANRCNVSQGREHNLEKESNRWAQDTEVDELTGNFFVEDGVVQLMPASQ